MSSTNSVYTISNCLDGDTTTTYCESGSTSGDYIVITIAGQYVLQKVVVYNKGSPSVSNNRLKYSNDFQGSSSSIRYQTTFSGAQSVYTFKFPTYLRIQLAVSPNWLCMAEIELYTSSNVKIPNSG